MKRARHVRDNEWTLSAGTEVWEGVLEFVRTGHAKAGEENAFRLFMTFIPGEYFQTLELELSA